MKKCSTCGVEKSTDSFNRDKSKRDGLCSVCRDCAKSRSLTWYSANKDSAIKRAVDWNRAHPDRIEASRQKWAAENVDRVKAATTRWAAENRDRRRQQAAVRRAADRARDTGMKTKWAASNPTKVKEARDQWRSRNPERARVDSHVRRSRSQGGRFTLSRVKELFIEQRGLCVYCASDLLAFHIDHRMPLALGGPNDDTNIQLLCPPCNLKKHAKHPEVFEKEIGYARPK